MRQGTLALALILVGGCASPNATQEAAGDAGVWLSSDGVEWSAVAEPALGGPGDQQMTGITLYGTRLVAVGFERLNGKVGGRAWLSDDGLDWEEVELPGDGDNWVWSVEATPDLLIAAGESTSDDETDAAIWVSNDGLTWNEVNDPDLSAPDYSGLRSIALHQGTIVVGGAYGEVSAVWFSSDGVSWDGPIELATGVTPVGLSAGSKGLIAVGTDGVDGAIWQSEDGASWSKIEEPTFAGDGYQTLTDATEGSQGWVTVGFEQLYEEIFYLGRGELTSADAGAWLSAEDRWTRVEDPVGLGGVGDQQIYSLTAWGSGFVAGGIDNSDPREVVVADFDSGVNVDAAIWLSDDGRRWTRVRSAAFGGENWQDILQVIPFKGLLVAVGGDDSGSQ